MIRAGQTGPIGLVLLSASVDSGNIAANTAVKTSGITLTGVEAGDTVVPFTNDATLNAGLVVSNVTVTAANTIDLTIANVTAGGINPGAVLFQFLVLKGGVCGP